MSIVYAADAKALVQPYLDKIKVAVLYPLILLLLGIALLMFLWGVLGYIRNAEGDEARETGKRHMLFGIIGLVIMVSALAILEIATRTFGIEVPK